MYHNPWQQWPQGVGATSDFAVASAQNSVGLGLVGLPAQASTGMDYQQQLQYGAQFGQFPAQGVPMGFGQWPSWGATDMSQWAGQFPAATAMVPGMAVDSTTSAATTNFSQASTGKTDGNVNSGKTTDNTSLMANQWAGSTYNYGQQPSLPQQQTAAAWGQVDSSSTAATGMSWTSQPPPPPPSQAPSQAPTHAPATDTVGGGLSKPSSTPQVPDNKLESQNTVTQDPKGKSTSDEEEQAFEQHFKDWESQFQSWREQNKNHPDKEAYQRYENQWQEWHQQLLARRDQMRSKKSTAIQGDNSTQLGKSVNQAEVPLPGNSSVAKGPDGLPSTNYGQVQPQYGAGMAQSQNTTGTTGIGHTVLHGTGLPGMSHSGIGSDPTGTGVAGMSPSGLMTGASGVGHGISGIGSRPGSSDYGSRPEMGQAGIGPGMGPHTGMGPGIGQSGMGPGIGQSGMGPGIGQSGMGPGMGQSGMGPGMGQSGMGPGMGQSGMGPGIGQSGMGPGMGQSGMGPGMGPSGMGPGMGQSGMGPGMGQSGMGPGMGQSGMGPGMGQSGIGPGIGQSGMGPGMGQPGVGPALGHSKMGPGMPQSKMGPGMTQSKMGPGMGQSGMGPGMGPSGIGPGMGHSGMGPGMGQSGMDPGMGQPGMGSGLSQSGMGSGMGQSGIGPKGMVDDQQGMGRPYSKPGDEPYNRYNEKPGWDQGPQNRNPDNFPSSQQSSSWDEDRFGGRRPWEKNEFSNQQRSDMRPKQMGDWNQGNLGKEDFPNNPDSQARRPGFDSFPNSNERLSGMRDWGRGREGPPDMFPSNRDRWNPMDDPSKNQRGPMGDPDMDRRSWNKPGMDSPSLSDRPWNRDGDYGSKPGFGRSDMYGDDDKFKRSEFESKRSVSKFPLDSFEEKAPEEYGMWPGEDEWNADDKDESEKKTESSGKDDWDDKRFGSKNDGSRSDDWREKNLNDKNPRGWQNRNQDDKGDSFKTSRNRDEMDRFRQGGLPDSEMSPWDRSRFGGSGPDRWQDNFGNPDPDRRQGPSFGDMRGRDDQRSFNQDPKGRFSSGGNQFGQNSRDFPEGRMDMGFNQDNKGQFENNPPGFQRQFGSKEPNQGGDRFQGNRPDMPFNQDRFGMNRQQGFQQEGKNDKMNRPPFMDSKGRQDMPYNQGPMYKSDHPFNQEQMGQYGQKDDFPNRGSQFGQEQVYNQQGPNQRRNEDFGGPFGGDHMGRPPQQSRFGPGQDFQQGPPGNFGHERPGFNQLDKPNEPPGMFGQGGPGNENQRFGMPNDPKHQFGVQKGSSRFDSPNDQKHGPPFGPGSKDMSRLGKHGDSKLPFAQGGLSKDDSSYDKQSDPKRSRNEPSRFDKPNDGNMMPPSNRFGEGRGPGMDHGGPDNKNRFGPNESRLQSSSRPNEQQNRMLPRPNEQENRMPGSASNPDRSSPKKNSKLLGTPGNDSGFCGDLDLSFEKWTEQPINQMKQGDDNWQDSGDSKMKGSIRESPANKRSSAGGNASSPSRKRQSKWGPVDAGMDSNQTSGGEIVPKAEGDSSEKPGYLKPPTPPHIILKEETGSTGSGSESSGAKSDQKPSGNSSGSQVSPQDRRNSLLGSGPNQVRPGFQPRPFGNRPGFGGQQQQNQPFGNQGPRAPGPRGPRPQFGNQGPRAPGPGQFGGPSGPDQAMGPPPIKCLLPTPNAGSESLLPTPGSGNDGLLPTPGQSGNEKDGFHAGQPNQMNAGNKDLDQNQKMEGTAKKPLLPPPSSGPKGADFDITKNPFLSEKEQEMIIKATEDIKEIQKYKDRVKGLGSLESQSDSAANQADSKKAEEKPEMKEKEVKVKEEKDSTKGTTPTKTEKSSDSKGDSKKESAKDQVGSDSRDSSTKPSGKTSQDSKSQKSSSSDSKGDSKSSGSKGSDRDKGSDRSNRDSDRYDRNRDRERDRDRDRDFDYDRRRDSDNDRNRGGRSRGGMRGPGFGHEPDFRGEDHLGNHPGKRHFPFVPEEDILYGRHQGGSPFNNLQPFDGRPFPGPMDPGNRRVFREVDYGHRTAEAVLGHTYNEAFSSFANYGNFDILSGPSYSKASVETYDYCHGKNRNPEIFIDDRYLLGTYDAFASVKEGIQAFMEQPIERPRERLDYHEDQQHRYKEKSRHDFEKYDLEKAYDSPRRRGNEKDHKEKNSGCLFPSVREPHPEVVTITDLLSPPGRNNRPPLLVLVLRGPPGSGKTHLAKLIKDQEVENGGTAPRMLCLDDYFMVESERTIQDPETGKRVKAKEFKYEYEAEMEETYRQSLLKSFKKTVDDKFFPFIIVDSVNMKTKHYEEFCVYAKQKGFQVYIGDMDCMDPVVCHKRNVHKRALEDIMRIVDSWDPTPNFFHKVDMKSLLQDISIPDVEMEEQTEEPTKESPDDEVADSDNLGHVLSKWEKMEATDSKLDRLDGLCGPKRKHSSMEDYLQLPDDYAQRKSQPGKKRVRWADIEEHKEQDRLRAIGFVVGQTDWDKLTDPTHADRALTRTKYF